MFEPVELSWEGRDFTIPSDRVMGAILVVEEIVTLHELASMQPGAGGHVNISKIAKAYTALLRYAGCITADMEGVYRSMFSDGGQKNAVAAVQALLYMMIPPKTLTLGAAAKDAKPAGKARAGRSSKPRTKQRSA